MKIFFFFALLTTISSVTAFWQVSFPVKAHGGSASYAKNEALKNVYQEAWEQLIKKGVPQEFYKKALNEVDASLMVKEFSLKGELIMPHSYAAQIVVTFKEDAVKKLLKERSIPFCQKMAPKVLIVPIANEEQEVWMSAWQKYTFSNTLFTYIVPLNDLQDQDRLAHHTHIDTLKQIALRYGVTHVFVIKMHKKKNEYEVSITPVFFKPSLPIHHVKVENLGNTLEDLIKITISKMEETWKKACIESPYGIQMRSKALFFKTGSLKDHMQVWARLEQQCIDLHLLSFTKEGMHVSCLNPHVDYSA